MNKLLLILLFPLFLFSQISTSAWDKIKQRDDILHVYGSGIITIVTSEITYNYTHNIDKSILIGAGTSLTIGIIGKEFIYDKWMGKGVFNVMDIFYDCWGTLIAVIIERCWMDMRGFETLEIYQDPYDSQVRTRNSKRWSLRINGFLN